MYEICEKICLNEHLCVMQVLLCALISRPACVRTHAQLRGNIVWNSYCFNKSM